MAATDVVQLNVRMDRALRDRGNRSLEEVSFSPSEFVRLAWEKVSRRGAERANLLAVLSEPAPSTEMERKLAAFHQGDEIVTAAMKRLGIGDGPHDLPSEEEINGAWFEHLFAKGME